MRATTTLILTDSCRLIRLYPIFFNPLDWDRYSYVRNNPVNATDPSGHATCDEEGNCYDRQGWHPAPGTHFSVVDTWKKTIWGKFGVNMSYGGNKKWDTANLQLIFQNLNGINNALNGKLQAMVGGAAFKLMNHGPEGGDYYGSTHIQKPTGVDFYTKGTQALRQMNIFPEFGHLLDNVPGTWNAFTNAVANANNPSWVSNGVINPDLLSLTITNDPNYPSVQTRQTFSNQGPSEQWADAFANCVAGNIDLSDPLGPGTALYNFVGGALAP